MKKYHDKISFPFCLLHIRLYLVLRIDIYHIGIRLGKSCILVHAVSVIHHRDLHVLLINDFHTILCIRLIPVNTQKLNVRMLCLPEGGRIEYSRLAFVKSMVSRLCDYIKSRLCQRVAHLERSSHKPASRHILVVIDQRCLLIDGCQIGCLDITCHLRIQGIIIPGLLILFPCFKQGVLQNIVSHCNEVQLTVCLLLLCLFLSFFLLGSFDLFFLFYFFPVVAHRSAHDHHQQY